MAQDLSQTVKLREFISKVGMNVCLQYDSSYHLCQGIAKVSESHRKFGSNAYVVGEWFDRLPERVQVCIWEASFRSIINIFSRVWVHSSPTSVLTLMEHWKDSTHSFHLPFGEMTITLVDFIVIIELSSSKRSVVFNDRLRTLNS